MSLNYYKEYSGNLGLQYPFYKIGNPEQATLDIKEILDLNQQYTLDLQALVEIGMRSYILGNRTLLNEINRYPFISSFNKQKNTFEYNYKLSFGSYDLDEDTIALKLKELLIQETLLYINDFRRVGILLSGGMDSRILAGILREIQLKEYPDLEVVVFNWGLLGSRDRIYAERIADNFDWEYIGIEVTPDMLKENFYENLSIGCEISPVNLHAMKIIRDFEGVDLVLAGSYGDTIGRGEYNGIRIDKAKEIIFNDVNRRGVFKENLIKEFKENIYAEQQSIFNLFSHEFPNRYVKKEFEYHRSHTRRYLTTAMSLIAQKKVVLQMFTSPRVVSFLWSLPLSLRYDRLYWLLLKELPKELLEIPWARTGLKFYENTGVPDEYSKSHHKYGEWLRGDLKPFVLALLENQQLHELGIFNEDILYMKIKMWAEDNNKTVTSSDQLLSWMANFSLFLKNNKVNIESNKIYKNTINDKLNYFKHWFKDYSYLKGKKILGK